MSSSHSQAEVDRAVEKYGLSQRAVDNSFDIPPWDMLEKLFSNIWRPDHPDGL